MARKKRKAGTLLILLGVLVLMILLYLLVMNKNKNEEEEVTEDTITLSSIDSDTVTEISYTLNGTTLTYMKANDTWVDKSDTKAPINQDTITNMLSQVTSLSADKIVVEDPEDLSEYGLEDPALVVNLTCEDGTTFELNIGDTLAIGTGYYAKLPDNNTVYSVTSGVYSAFNYTQTQMIEVEEFPTITTTNITNINVVKDGTNIFKADYDQSAADAGEYYAWEISKPYSTVQKGDPTKFDSYFESYGSVSLSECVDYKGTDLSKYGLDNPSATIELSYYTETTEDSTSTTEDEADTTGDALTDSTTDSEVESTTTEEEDTQEATTVRTDYKVTILVGDKNDDGEYYVQVKSDGREYKNAVYTIATSSIDAMLDITPYDYVTNLVQLVDITTLDKLTVKANGETYTLAVTPNPDKDKDMDTKKEADDSEESDSTDEESEVVSDSLYYYNGIKVEETAFKNLYQELIGITTSGEIKKEVSDSTPVYEFDFIRNSNFFEELHIKYLPYDGVNFYRVSINGEENFLVEKAAVDKVIKELTEFTGE